MSIPEEVFKLITSHLDFKELARLCSTYKESYKTLKQDLAVKSHPHAVAFIAHNIMAERLRMPSGEFELSVRNETLVLFNSLNSDGNGPTTRFSVETGEDKQSIEVKVNYGHRQEDLLITGSSVSVVIIPSSKSPIRSGRIQITRGDGPTTTTEYTNGIDPRLVLEWCPLDTPNDLE